MAGETRVLRPFETMYRTQKLMNLGVKIKAAGKVGSGGMALNLSVDQYLTSPVELWLSDNAESHQEFETTVFKEVAELFPECSDVVWLVISINNRRLKITETLKTLPINPTAGYKIPHFFELTANERPLPLRMPVDGCDVLVEFVLGEDVPEPRQPLMAWRKGSWLARTQINIRCPTKTSGPRPKPLGQEERGMLGLPDGTLHFCDFKVHGGEILRAKTFDDVMDFYVDERVLDSAALPAHQTENWAKRLQHGWVLYAISQIVYRACGTDEILEFNPTEAPWDDSVLSVILAKIVSEGPKIDLEVALEWLWHRPERLIAELEACAELSTLERKTLSILEKGPQ